MTRFQPVTTVKKIIKFLTHDMWHLTNEDVKGSYRFFVNIIKALYLSLRFFFSERLMEKASALTYYTLLAIVPIVAVIVAIARGFNLLELIQKAIIDMMPAQEQTVDFLFGFADSYLEHTKTGLVMGIGVLLLIWVIINLIGNIETVFNKIWQQKKDRSAVRKLTDYLAIIIMVPLFLAVSSGIDIFSQTIIKSESFDYEMSKALIRSIHWTRYLLIYIAFFIVYVVIPNTKVKYFNAFIAALVAGSIFMGFEWLYINGQIWVSKYNAIYGSFAALPLLLLFIQMAWVITLYGAELSYAAQNIQNFNYEKDTQNISQRYYDFMTIVVAGMIYNRFKNPELDEKGEKVSMTTEDISQILHLPSKLANKIISHLSELDIIRETIDNNNPDQHIWTPGRDISTYSIADMLEEMDLNGTKDFKYDYDGIFNNEWITLCQMRKAQYDAGKSALLSNIELHTNLRKKTQRKAIKA